MVMFAAKGCGELSVVQVMVFSVVLCDDGEGVLDGVTAVSHAAEERSSRRGKRIGREGRKRLGGNRGGVRWRVETRAGPSSISVGLQTARIDFPPGSLTHFLPLPRTPPLYHHFFSSLFFLGSHAFFMDYGLRLLPHCFPFPSVSTRSNALSYSTCLSSALSWTRHILYPASPPNDQFGATGRNGSRPDGEAEPLFSLSSLLLRRFLFSFCSHYEPTLAPAHTRSPVPLRAEAVAVLTKQRESTLSLAARNTTDRIYGNETPLEKGLYHPKFIHPTESSTFPRP